MALALNQRFETEEQCLEHSAKIAALKPGDVVYIDGWKKGIYWMPEEQGARLFVLVYEDDKETGRWFVSPGCITFEPVRSQAEAEAELASRQKELDAKKLALSPKPKNKLAHFFARLFGN